MRPEDLSKYDNLIRERRGVDEITALKWLQEQRAIVSYLQSGHVVVFIRGKTATRDTLNGAVLAIVLDEDPVKIKE